MGIYKIGKCDYCGDENKILRPSPFMGFTNMMCEYCWNETKYEYEASNGEYIVDFQSNQEEYNEIDEIQKKTSTYEEELRRLEREFREVGYPEVSIEEIKHMDGSTEIEEFIANLEEEQSNWEY